MIKVFCWDLPAGFEGEMGGGMAIPMNMKKILCGSSLGIAGVLGLMFLLDLIIGIPFGRSDITTDILIILAAGLLIWQGVETWLGL